MVVGDEKRSENRESLETIVDVPVVLTGNWNSTCRRGSACLRTLAVLSASILVAQPAYAQRLKRSTPTSPQANDAKGEKPGGKADGPADKQHRPQSADAPANDTEFRSVTTDEISAEPFRHIGKIGNKQRKRGLGHGHADRPAARADRRGRVAQARRAGQSTVHIARRSRIERHRRLYRYSGPAVGTLEHGCRGAQGPSGCQQQSRARPRVIEDEQRQNGGTTYFAVRATGYDTPAQGVPVALNKATRGLIHRTGTVSDTPPDIDVLVAALDGAYRGYQIGKEFDGEGSTNYKAQGRYGKGKFSFFMEEEKEPAGFQGCAIGLVAGFAFGAYAARKPPLRSARLMDSRGTTEQREDRFGSGTARREVRPRLSESCRWSPASMARLASARRTRTSATAWN